MRYLVSFFFFFCLASFNVAFGQAITQNDGYYYKDGKLFSGIYEETNDKDLLISRLSIYKGLLDGKCDYFENGLLVEKRAFKKGKKHGAWSTFENEKKISEAFFLNDNKHGTWHIWDTNGVLRYEMFYKKGKKVGVWKMWDEKGNLISEKKY